MPPSLYNPPPELPEPPAWPLLWPALVRMLASTAVIVLIAGGAGRCYPGEPWIAGLVAAGVAIAARATVLGRIFAWRTSHERKWEWRRPRRTAPPTKAEIGDQTIVAWWYTSDYALRHGLPPQVFFQAADDGSSSDSPISLAPRGYWEPIRIPPEWI